MGRAGFKGFSILGAGVTSLALVVVVACGSDREGFEPPPDAGAGDLEGGGTFDPEGGFGGDGAVPDLPAGETRDPVDCEEAKSSKSYVGCDYWPTVTANNVWSIFDFAAVVANTGTKNAEVTVTGPNNTNKKVTVPAGELKKVYLPWVPALKGKDTDECGAALSFDTSVVAQSGAFHLVSTSPVIVYQFNALEYKGAGGENPDGTSPKDWSQCPGSAKTCPGSLLQPARKIGCFSFSNDASLLLPSTAMTTNYRVVGQHGWSEAPLFGGEQAIMGPTLAITATQAATEVTVTLSPTASVLAGGGVNATAGGGTIKLTLANPGDVAELAATKGKQYDFSGSLVQANKPIQVISAIPCINLPQGKQACDHIEESILPAETLGKHYAVVPPTGPKDAPVKHNVRFYGNKDGTTLTYVPSKPAKCPATLTAGQVVDCELVNEAFDVTGNNEFAVATFLLAATEIAAPPNIQGDPSQSIYAAVEQFRTKYVFLAPDDYNVSYADITGTQDAEITLDGTPLTAQFQPIGTTGLGVYRVKLGAGKGGAHVLTSKKPVGVQVIGYGDNTSYQYPAGLNLKLIAPPPPPPK
jgi:hypothetical protein